MRRLGTNTVAGSLNVTAHKWSSSLLGIVAAIGAEAGVASVWKFSYLAGTHGGGLFVFSYVIALVLIGIPALLAEMLIGRRGGGSMVGSIQALAAAGTVRRAWIVLGYSAFLCIVLTISYYYVICGWMLEYLQLALQGGFEGIDGAAAERLFTNMLQSPVRMLANSGVLIIISAVVVTRGLNHGLERFALILTPLRFAVLLLIAVFACIFADAKSAARFLFSVDLRNFDVGSVIAAVGQAFFSLGVGVGVMMTVGSYMKHEYSLTRVVTFIGFAQLAVALLAGMGIFPLIFSAHIAPTQGPGLLFVAIPLAIARMPGGYFLGICLFLSLTFAAVTATSVMFDAILAVTRKAGGTGRSAIIWAATLWALGIVTVLSFSTWSGFHPLNLVGLPSARNPFELLEYGTSNILMPLGGLLVSLLVGWGLPLPVVAQELKLSSNDYRILAFRFLTRWIIPAVVVVLFLLML